MNSKQFLRLPVNQQVELIGKRLLELYAQGKKTDAFKNNELNFSWSAANGYLKEYGYRMENTDYTLIRFAREGEKVVSEKEINKLFEQAEEGLEKAEELEKAQEEIKRLKILLEEKEAFCSESSIEKSELEEKVINYMKGEKILFCVKLPRDINDEWKEFAQGMIYEKSVTASMALISYMEKYQAGRVQPDEIINLIKEKQDIGYTTFSIHLPKSLVEEWKAMCKGSLVFNIGQMTGCALNDYIIEFNNR